MSMMRNQIQTDKRPVAGMSCGTDEPDSLLEGAFDESEHPHAQEHARMPTFSRSL